MLADGDIGVSGSPTVTDRSSRPWVIAAGVYDGDGPETHLLSGPTPARLEGALDRSAFRRILDFRSGLVAEVAPTDRGLIETVRFSSMCRPGTIVERITSDAALDPGPPLSPPEDGSVLDDGWSGPVQWMRVPATTGGIAAAAAADRHVDGSGEVFERFSHFAADADFLPDPVVPVAGAIDAQRDGFDRLLTEHRTCWAERWRGADIVIEATTELQTAVAFRAVPSHGLGPRPGRPRWAPGLSGPATGVTCSGTPTLRLALLRRDVPGFGSGDAGVPHRAASGRPADARALGRGGAGFPWESAVWRGCHAEHGAGPHRPPGPDPNRALEDHIVADVAWAAVTTSEWTVDEVLRRSPGWAAVGSRSVLGVADSDRPGRSGAHLRRDRARRVPRPVDDDAFTNVMARWNLSRAASAVEGARRREHHSQRTRTVAPTRRRARRRLRPRTPASTSSAPTSTRSSR